MMMMMMIAIIIIIIIIIIILIIVNKNCCSQKPRWKCLSQTAVLFRRAALSHRSLTLVK